MGKVNLSNFGKYFALFLLPIGLCCLGIENTSALPLPTEFDTTEVHSLRRQSEDIAKHKTVNPAQNKGYIKNLVSTYVLEKGPIKYGGEYGKGEAFIVMGLPGSGKSTLVEGGDIRDFNKIFSPIKNTNYLTIDADRISTSLKFDFGITGDELGLGGAAVAGATQDTVNKIISKMSKDRSNFIWYTVGRDKERLKERIKGLKDAGYEVTLVYVATDPILAIKSSLARYNEYHDRWVDPEYIWKVSGEGDPRKNAVEDTFQYLKGLANTYFKIARIDSKFEVEEQGGTLTSKQRYNLTPEVGPSTPSPRISPVPSTRVPIDSFFFLSTYCRKKWETGNRPIKYDEYSYRIKHTRKLSEDLFLIETMEFIQANPIERNYLPSSEAQKYTIQNGYLMVPSKNPKLYSLGTHVLDRKTNDQINCDIISEALR